VAVNVAALLRKALAQRFRARGLQYLVRRQQDLTIAVRERNWALRGLLGFEVRELKVGSSRLRHLRSILRLSGTDLFRRPH
jgi:hypothetical protein